MFSSYQSSWLVCTARGSPLMDCPCHVLWGILIAVKWASDSLWANCRSLFAWAEVFGKDTPQDPQDMKEH